MVVVIIEKDTTGQAIFEPGRVKEDNILFRACMMTHRNNEMVNLIAKYFLRFLHELTVSSSLQSITTDCIGK
jgi:adenine/guanine phosphoribosyltransferase-like PRPP-binding protein